MVILDVLDFSALFQTSIVQHLELSGSECLSEQAAFELPLIQLLIELLLLSQVLDTGRGSGSIAVLLEGVLALRLATEKALKTWQILQEIIFQIL